MPRIRFVARFESVRALAGGSATATADIAQATIASVGGITAANKVYDGNTSATLSTSAASFSGMVAGDTLSLAGASGAFANKNAGTGKTVLITGVALSGADAANYTLATNTASAMANIDAKSASVTGAAVASKTYDGTTNATVASAGSLVGAVLGDNVTLTGGTSASFADKNAGLARPATINGYS